MAVGGIDQGSRYYVSGSRYKRFFGTNAFRANRQAYQDQLDQIGSFAAAAFGNTISQASGQVALAVQAAIDRTKAKLVNLTA